MSSVVNACHAERSKKPIHFAHSEKIHRSLASLSMTKFLLDTGYSVLLFSPLQQIHFVYIDRLLVAEEGDQNSEPDRSLGGGVGNHENGKYLAVQSSPKPRKRNQVEVHSVQNQFDRHQDDDHVAARQHANHAKQEKGSAQDQEM